MVYGVIDDILRSYLVNYTRDPDLRPIILPYTNMTLGLPRYHILAQIVQYNGWWFKNDLKIIKRTHRTDKMSFAVLCDQQYIYHVGSPTGFLTEKLIIFFFFTMFFMIYISVFYSGLEHYIYRSPWTLALLSFAIQIRPWEYTRISYVENVYGTRYDNTTVFNFTRSARAYYML